MVSLAFVFAGTLTAPRACMCLGDICDPSCRRSPYKPCTLALTREGAVFNLESLLGRLKFVRNWPTLPLSRAYYPYVISMLVGHLAAHI